MAQIRIQINDVYCFADDITYSKGVNEKGNDEIIFSLFNKEDISFIYIERKKFKTLFIQEEDRTLLHWKAQKPTKTNITKDKRLKRDVNILKLHKEGKNKSEIAQELNCTRQTVYSALRRDQEKKFKDSQKKKLNPDITDLWTIEKNLGIYTGRDKKDIAIDSIIAKLQQLKK